MGLDMFLLDSENYSGTPELCYWRKANAVHNWFVQNVQSGVDDCGSYPVTQTQLKSLIEVCKTALELSKHDQKQGMDLIPPTPGFFFGSQDFQFWKEDLEFTVEKLSKLIDTYEGPMFYHSSW